ncbi:unnamed protein product [Phytophthora lilii]|uniref:Unnamed protein product n=1 Tax=Phytophthora lilii TaxID=2077276 RepID=A0A9W6TGM7_9STRA|nr:unnamed protein product [Phytophthora lilii]
MTDRFDQPVALKVFNDWETSKYHPKLTESQIKAIAGGTDQVGYKKWKAEYEPTEIREKKEKKQKTKKDDDFSIPYYPKFHIYYEKGELPPIFDCKNPETYLDIISLKKEVITMENLYKFIKNNIAYILQRGNGYYLTKNWDAFGEIDYAVVEDIKQFDMVCNINNANELDDDGKIETDNTELDMDHILSLRISDVIYHNRDDITYGKVDFMPYNAKTGACDSQSNTFNWNSNEVFNKFNGFVHTYMTLTLLSMKRGSSAIQIISNTSGAVTPKITILTGRFNSAREHKILTIINEAANVKQSSHEDQDELKDCITEPTSSKHRIECVDLLCKNDRLDDKAYFKAYINEFNQADGDIHLHHYLMSIDLEGFHPQNDAPMTKEESNMQKSAIEKPIQWLIECVTNSTINNIFQKSQIEKTPALSLSGQASIKLP